MKAGQNNKYDIIETSGLVQICRIFVLNQPYFYYSLQHTEIAESAKELRALKPKRIKENRNILANIEDSNWDSEFTCHLCSDKIPNVQLAFEHMIQKHSNNSKKPKHFANDKSDQIEVNCIECDNGPFKGKIQFKIHLWRHLNSYEPPRRGRKKGAYPAWYERKIWTCKSCPVEESLIEGIEALIEHRKLRHDEKELFRYEFIHILS